MFLMVEESLNQSYQLKLQTFMQVPEAHSDYDAKREEFLEYYNKQHGGKIQDVDQCERAWKVFWEDTVGIQLHDEWEKSKNKLVEQFKVISNSSSSSSSKEDHPKRVKRDESDKENSTLRSSNTNPQSSLVVCQKQKSESLPLSLNTSTKKTSKHSSDLEFYTTDVTQCKQLVSGVNEASTSSQPKSQTSLMNMDKINADNTRQRVRLILESFSLLTELGQSLDTLAPAVVPIIKSVLDKGVYSQEALLILAKVDNADVMKKCSEKLIQLSGKAKGDYKRKLRRCSIDIIELLENVVTSLKNIKVMQELDIPSIARATDCQDMTYILQFIEDALATKGLYNSSKSLLNEVFLAVSSYQFNFAVQKLSAASPGSGSHTSIDN